MPHYPYLILGGGMTAAGAVDGIRRIDPDRPIGMISAEPDRPYKRPPLTKKLWQGKPLDSIWLPADDDPGVHFYPGCTVTSVDPGQKTVLTQDGQQFTYDRLLFATGGTPRRLPYGGDDIIYYRTLQDYQNVRRRAEQGQRFAIIGGGFIGSELAASLRTVGSEVVLLFPENGISERVYPRDLATYLVDFYRSKGVEVYPGEMVAHAERLDGRMVVRTQSGKEIQADAVVAGIGIQPNTRLAEEAGIKVDNGIVVDEYLQTNQPDIYAAGDVANFYNPQLNKRLRVEHADNATSMGEYAGRIMAGEQIRYDYLPFFYSDLFELGYEAVGELDSRLETFTDWIDPFKKGIVYYMNDSQVRGVLLWNVWDKVSEARELIGTEIDPEDLAGRF